MWCSKTYVYFPYGKDWNFLDGGGSVRPNLKKCMKLIPEVWIFFVTTQWKTDILYTLLTITFFPPGWTRLSRLKIHFHTENKTGLQRLPCFPIRTRHRTFMNLSGKIIQSRNYCSNCNHYKRLSKRKLIKSNQSWLLSMSTVKTPTSFIVIRCQNS